MAERKERRKVRCRKQKSVKGSRKIEQNEQEYVMKRMEVKKVEEKGKLEQNKKQERRGIEMKRREAREIEGRERGR